MLVNIIFKLFHFLNYTLKSKRGDWKNKRSNSKAKIRLLSNTNNNSIKRNIINKKTSDYKKLKNSRMISWKISIARKYFH